MAAWIRCSRVMLAVLIVAIFVESASAAGCGWNSSTYGLSSTFGGLGVENALFSPGALDGHAMWVDPVSGNLYLFGGTDLSSEPQSALWRYNITSGLWALLGGDVSPPAGSPVGSQAGWPAGTAWAGVAQLPNGDALIVMGTGSTVGDIVHSSVWRYSITSSSWTLLSGKANAPLVATIKSTVGNTTVYSSAAAAAGYAPNGRSRHACAVDGEGRLWIYGGTGYGTFYGDVWSFDLATAAWTYWGGVGDTTAARIYTPTYTGPAPTPNIRDSQRWVWLRNKLWMFGGDNEECYADLWTFDTASPASGWTFVGGAQGNSCLSALGGSFPPGCSTPPCVCPAGSADTCFPPTRDLFAMWTNGDDALFVYGGYDWAAGLSADQAPWDDVWVYNITTQLWMWFAGSPNPGNMPDYTLHRPGGRSGGFFAYSLQRSLIYIACGVQGDRNRASDLWVAPLCLFGSLVPVCSPPTPPYPGSVCTSQGWIVPGTLQLPPGSTTPITGVVVVGGFVLPPSAVIEIVGGSGIIQSSGAVTLNGTVVVVINTDPGSGISIPLVSAGTVNLGPQFALQVNKNFTGCRHVSGKASYSQGTLSALIDVGGCGSKRLATGAIIGIVVAGAVAIAVIVILLIVLAKCGRANRLFGTKQEIGDIR